jgi:hypothetical protein
VKRGRKDNSFSIQQTNYHKSQAISDIDATLNAPHYHLIPI